jgi:predicted house-cleaning noncanonical NTP pyrophosphatase (MazG superfamily)
MLEYYSSEPILHLMTPMDMVTEFAEKTGQKPDPILYGRLIEEEYKEWAEEVFDKAAELKELADLVYVIYGYAKAHGYNLDEAVRRVHKNNLGRCTQPDGTIKRREDGKIIKNPDYPKVALGDLV